MWNDEITVLTELRALTARPLSLSVFDEDELSRDDSLGDAELTLSLDLLHSKQVRGRGVSFCLPLSTQGQLWVVVICKDYTPPSYQRLLRALVVDVCLDRIKVCARLVAYYRLPYDRTFFSKMKEPWTIVLMAVAASPEIIVRGLFFSLFLLIIIQDKNEYQLFR